MHTFQIGDSVCLKNWDELAYEYGVMDETGSIVILVDGYCMMKSFKKYLVDDLEVTIKEIFTTLDGYHRIRVEFDGKQAVISPSMVKRLPENNINIDELLGLFD